MLEKLKKITVLLLSLIFTKSNTKVYSEEEIHVMKLCATCITLRSFNR